MALSLFSISLTFGSIGWIGWMLINDIQQLAMYTLSTREMLEEFVNWFMTKFKVA